MQEITALQRFPASFCFGILSIFAVLGFSQDGFAAENASDPPNIVILFADDQGYADIGCFGAKGFQTPNLDRMAEEGMKLTNFYVAQAVCGASRAALLTGCYPNRIGMLGAPAPRAKHGIHPDEVLIPELCREKGYATAMCGKWHLGDARVFLPLQNGFDEYIGLPYSNDMWPFHPTNKKFPNLPLISGNDVLNPNVTAEDQKQLTNLYTEHATRFIREHHQKPFFLYVAYAMPHVPLFASEKFAGTSEQGAYGDVIQEIDWSVGEILKALEENGVSKNTLVIYTADNGPWLSYGNHAGSASPLREGKGTTFEGGMREPCIVRWPARIPAGTVCDELASTIDLLPTIAELISAKLPDHPIDGKNILPLLIGQKGARTPHEYFCYYWGNDLEAIRSGDWKLHFPHQYRTLPEGPGKDGVPGKYKNVKLELSLFNLKEDIGEQHNVVAEHPEVVERLKQYAEQARTELGDGLTARPGKSIRPHATLPPEKN